MEAPYGSWASPIKARRIAEGGMRLSWPQAVGEAAYWVEMRPAEGGRYVVVRRGPDGAIADVTPPDVNVRTRVHEYGGGMYVAFGDGHGGQSVIYSDFADQRLYRQDLADDGDWSAPRPMTSEPPIRRAWRYADGRVTLDGRTLICVRERHGADGVVNDLVALPTGGAPAPGGTDVWGGASASDSVSASGGADARPGSAAQPTVVASGHDFYAAPRLSPDGRRLAYLAWDHPRMPWDGTELHVVELDQDGRAGADVVVVGGADESVLQPTWTAGGDLLFVTDGSGWWNLCRLDAAHIEAALGGGGRAEAGGASHGLAQALAPMPAEFAKPHWVFGLGTIDVLPGGALVAVFTRDGDDHLALVDGDGVREIAAPFTEYSAIVALGERLLVTGASPDEGERVALVDPHGDDVEVLRRGREDRIDPRYLSRPQAVAFPTWYEPDSVTGPLADELATASAEYERSPSSQDATAASGLLAHALYFPPTNPDFSAPAGEKPPLLVISHGGPTSAHGTGLSMDVQYWTSRGFAVVDVNYGGSTGYGRAYRERLKGNWGVVDTVDCIRAAEFLVARGDVDPARLAVRGGSAGGYTTLNALTRFDTFAAGASHFGLADLERFVDGGTHKFEERYLFPLIGPYPEAADVYRERSPIHHVDEIGCPVILFQGLEDEIVPPEQAEMIVAALARKGLPYAYLPFEGEQHGFRKAENIVRSLEAELYFYGAVFGFTPADEIEPVAIANLPG
jgi:dipeptidyl aminopeptidase/acylaminoacyl peptidase